MTYDTIACDNNDIHQRLGFAKSSIPSCYRGGARAIERLWCLKICCGSLIRAIPDPIRNGLLLIYRALALVVMCCRLLGFQHLQNRLRINREAGRRLARWILLERLHKFLGVDRALHVQVDVLRHPVHVLVRGNIGPLVGVHAQVVDLGKPQTDEGLHPDIEVARGALLAEDELPVVVPHGDELAVVIEIEEVVARRGRFLPFKVGKNVVAIQVDLEDLATGTGRPSLE